MVCPRCIDTVDDIFKSMQINVRSIQLGEVIVDHELNETERTVLDERLKEKGFELLRDSKSRLISQIKAIVVEQIHHSTVPLSMNFSTYLSEKLNHEYGSLSRLFSSVESITIERFVLKQKIERVKELIFYNELTLSEIAYQLGYSSVAHLSSQFKKETGMTPTAFKNQHRPGHRALDSI